MTKKLNDNGEYLAWHGSNRLFVEPEGKFVQELEDKAYRVLVEDYSIFQRRPADYATCLTVAATSLLQVKKSLGVKIFEMDELRYLFYHKITSKAAEQNPKRLLFSRVHATL